MPTHPIECRQTVVASEIVRHDLGVLRGMMFRSVKDHEAEQDSVRRATIARTIAALSSVRLSYLKEMRGSNRPIDIQRDAPSVIEAQSTTAPETAPSADPPPSAGTPST